MTDPALDAIEKLILGDVADMTPQQIAELVVNAIDPPCNLLAGEPAISDGTVARACREAQGEFRRAPLRLDADEPTRVELRQLFTARREMP
jgi:hypothetical protein